MKKVIILQTNQYDFIWGSIQVHIMKYSAQTHDLICYKMLLLFYFLLLILVLTQAPPSTGFYRSCLYLPKENLHKVAGQSGRHYLNMLEYVG